MKRNWTRRGILVAGAALATAPLWAPSIRAADALSVAYDFPPDGRWSFEVLYGETPAGVHIMDFRRSGGRLDVAIRTEIRVTAMLVIDRSFSQRASEVWEGGRLMQIVSQANDDGDVRAVELHRSGERLVGSYNGEARDLPATLPASLWHPATVTQTVLLETSKAKLREVVAEELPPEDIALGSATLATRHYRLAGPKFQREVWYGAGGELLQAIVVTGGAELLIRRAG